MIRDVDSEWWRPIECANRYQEKECCIAHNYFTTATLYEKY